MRDYDNKKGLRSEGSSSNGQSPVNQLQSAVSQTMVWVGPLAGEWLVAIAVGATGLLINKFVAPHMKLVQTGHDEELSYPVVEQTVTEPLMIVVGLVLPMIVVMAVCEMVSDRRDMHINGLMLLQSSAVSVFVTTVAKKQAGRPRPNFYAMCKWNTTSTGAEGCTAERKWDWESRQSFPSGHSSFAFAGLLFLSLFLMEKVAQLAKKRKLPLAVPLSVAQMASCLPACLAMWVAISRVVDYWHNYDDILAGSVLGSMCAYHAWTQRLRYNAQWFGDKAPGLVGSSADSVGLNTAMEEGDESNV